MQYDYIITCINSLTHWGRVTHICIGNLTIIGSDNGLSPGRCQAIIWTNAGKLLIETNFNEILIGIQTFSFKKMHLKMSSAKWRPFCLGLNVLRPLWRESTCHIPHGFPSQSASNAESISMSWPHHVGHWSSSAVQVCQSLARNWGTHLMSGI